MLCYLVYDSDYKLYEVFENRPTFSYELGWSAVGWHDIVSSCDIPESTKEVLAEKGILKVFAAPRVLFHTSASVKTVVEGE